MSENTVFHIRCHELGLPPIGGLAYFLPLYLGWGTANRLLMATTTIDAQQAFGLGLVEHVVPDDSFENMAFEQAHLLGQKSRESVSSVKRLLNMHFLHMDSGFENERQTITEALSRWRSRGRL